MVWLSLALKDDDLSRWVTSKHIDGLNYLTWAHTFKVIINGKRKLSYLTDSPPPKEDPKLADWESEDSVVMAGCGTVWSLILLIQWNFVTLQRRIGILLANPS